MMIMSKVRDTNWRSDVHLRMNVKTDVISNFRVKWIYGGRWGRSTGSYSEETLLYGEDHRSIGAARISERYWKCDSLIMAPQRAMRKKSLLSLQVQNMMIGGCSNFLWGSMIRMDSMLDKER